MAGAEPRSGTRPAAPRRHGRALALLSLLLLALLLGAAPVAAQNPFGPRAGTPATPPAGSSPFGPRAGAPAVEATQPAWYAPLVLRVAAIQRDFSTRLTGAVRDLRGEAGAAALLTILLASFLYGVFHAAGPGHGKVVTSTWLLTQRGALRHGLLMSGVVALVQAVTAVLLVSVLALLPWLSRSQAVQRTVLLELLSYGLIALLGLGLAWRALRGHGHDHHHHGPPAGSAPGAPLGPALLAAGIAGLRPCTGALLVLLFTLANGVFLVGIAATFVMGLGVWLTLGLLALGTVALRLGGESLGARAGGRWAAHAPRVWQALALAGALLLTAAGVLFFLGALSRMDSLI